MVVFVKMDQFLTQILGRVHAKFSVLSDHNKKSQKLPDSVVY